MSSRELGGKTRAGRGGAGQGQGAGAWANPAGELVLGGASLPQLPSTPALFPLIHSPLTPVAYLMHLTHTRCAVVSGPLYLLDYCSLRQPLDF